MSFLSHLHTDLRQARRVRRGATHAPEDVPQGLHKSYPRMELTELPPPAAIQATLSHILNSRISYRDGGDQSRSNSLDTWGTLLGLALKKRDGSHKRNYPSGGALYPIETYIIGTIANFAPSVFHYNPGKHALEKLWELPADFNIKDLAPSPQDLLFSSIIVFTAVWERSSAKYGDFAYTLALLEAGHMSENILLAATALKLKSRPMAGFDDDALVSLLDLDPPYEQPVHTITVSF
ncbi:SagB/ThcOx family dehydrogenase [Candidatus Parcubacteria bacterium]|nr:MAG: SagB/ThcOx family dehydrogenase [Candidatus Parcubacteria bacterium]